MCWAARLHAMCAQEGFGEGFVEQATGGERWCREVGLSHAASRSLGVCLLSVPTHKPTPGTHAACDPACAGAVYRLVTSPLFHVGAVHLGCNMLTWMSIAPGLERQFGTLQLAYLLFLFSALGDVLYLSVAALASAPPLR